MSKISYGREVEVLDETFETKNIHLCGISNMRIHTLHDEEEIGGNAALLPGKYTKCNLTLFIGPF